MRTRALDQISLLEKAKLEGQDVEAGRPVSRLLSEEVREVLRGPRCRERGGGGCLTSGLEFLRYIEPWRNS